jgi:hypothetical protein
MKRYLLGTALLVIAVASFELTSTPKAYAQNNCQPLDQACNPDATLNCCNGLRCEICNTAGCTPTQQMGVCKPA